MVFNFSSLNSGEDSPKHVDPVKLFRTLKVKDTSINDLWLAQGFPAPSGGIKG
jgi:hypothetical protein